MCTVYARTASGLRKQTFVKMFLIAAKILVLVVFVFYSYGHRNPQGLAWHPETGDLYASEHGPSGESGLGGNDEINRISAQII